MNNFKENLMKQLTENGFPQKKVSFSTEKLYESADKKGLSLNKVLEELKELGIQANIGVEKIIFSQIENNDQMNMSDIMEKANEYIKSMPKEEIDKMMEMFNQMSDKEKNDIMEKAKNMGMMK